MQSIKDILDRFNPAEDKYISREFQSFGVHLAEKLGDEKRKSLYINMAKNVPRAILEEALRFVSDANAKNTAALFMWKLKEMGTFEKFSLMRSGAKKKTVTKSKKAKKE